MKKSIVAVFLLALAFTACKKDEDKTTVNSSASSKVFALDSNRIITQNTDGSNAVTITTVPQSSTKSVFINSLSANYPVSKIAYIVRKGLSGSYSLEIHLADADGSNDKILKTIADNSAMPGIVKIGNNGLVYYTYTTSTLTNSQLYSIKEDGTAETKKSGTIQSITDISADGKYVTSTYSLGGKNWLVYFDITGDGGGGSPLYSESSASDRCQDARLTADGKYMIAKIYGNTITSIVYRVIDLANKTATDKTIITNPDTKFYNYHLAIGSDNDKLLVVASGDVSKSYIFSISQNKITSQFDNVNTGVYKAYIF